MFLSPSRSLLLCFYNYFYLAGDASSIPGSGRSPGEGIGYPLQYSWVSLVAQLVKNPPAMQETWVPSLGWKIFWRRERLPTPGFWPGEFHGLYSPRSHKESDLTEWLSLSLLLFFVYKSCWLCQWGDPSHMMLQLSFSWLPHRAVSWLPWNPHCLAQYWAQGVYQLVCIE